MLAAGGLAPDHGSWISSSRRFFLPIKVLSRVFRGKFVAALKTAFLAGALKFHGSLVHLAEPHTFAAWLRSLFRQDWVVYAKPPFGGPEHALRYFGAYTHRVAISNHRLVALEDRNITFRWRDSAHGNKKELMTLPVDEFLRRFLLSWRIGANRRMLWLCGDSNVCSLPRHPQDALLHARVVRTEIEKALAGFLINRVWMSAWV